MSIPLFFQPWRDGDSCFVDGGMLSNFPVDVFDRNDGVEPRWPTFGIKLSGRPDANQRPTKIGGPIGLLKGMVGTMTNFHDQMYLDQPSVVDRTIFVDCGKLRATDFNLTDADKKMLFDNGRAAAEKFLEHVGLRRLQGEVPRAADRRRAALTCPSGGAQSGGSPIGFG